MVARKHRTRVVLDTNVLVRNYKSRSPESPNQRVYRFWWVERRLQLLLSAPVIDEYLDTFAEVLGTKRDDLEELRTKFEHDSRCTVVGLARRYTESRDPDDNLFLATALAGRAEYLVTNDRNLLDLPEEFQRTLPFAIVTPAGFLREFEGE